jgi:hypothetical protein
VKNDYTNGLVQTVEAAIIIKYKDAEAVCARMVSEFQRAVEKLPGFLDWIPQHEHRLMLLLWDCAREAVEKVAGVSVAGVEREADEAPAPAPVDAAAPTLPAPQRSDYTTRNVALYAVWLDEAIKQNPELAAHREERLAGAHEFFEAGKSKTDKTKPQWQPLEGWDQVAEARGRDAIRNSPDVLPAVKDLMWNKLNGRDIKPEDRQAFFNRLVAEFPNLDRTAYMAKANELAPHMFPGWDGNKIKMKTFSNMLSKARSKATT